MFSRDQTQRSFYLKSGGFFLFCFGLIGLVFCLFGVSFGFFFFWHEDGAGFFRKVIYIAI